MVSDCGQAINANVADYLIPSMQACFASCSLLPHAKRLTA